MSSPKIPAAGWLVRCAAAFIVLAGSLCMAQDHLARLIPPGASVLAGMRQTPPASQDVLWLVTQNNVSDLRAFLALTARDSFREVDSVTVADYPATNGVLTGHLLIADGQFHPHALDSAGVPLPTTAYRGVPIVILPASAPGSGPLWFAILHGRIALCGSPSAVRLAIDRSITRAPADPAITERMRNIPRGDDAWSSILLNTQPVRAGLRLSSDRGPANNCLAGVHELTLGIRRRSNVQVDLRATGVAGRPQPAALDCISSQLQLHGAAHLSLRTGPHAASFLRASLSRDDYDRWLSSFRHSPTMQLLMASLGSPHPAFDQSGGSEPASLPNP